MMYLPSLGDMCKKKRSLNSVNIFHILNILYILNGDDAEGMDEFDLILRSYFTSRDKRTQDILMDKLTVNKLHYLQHPHSIDSIYKMTGKSLEVSQDVKFSTIVNILERDVFFNLQSYFIDKGECEQNSKNEKLKQDSHFSLLDSNNIGGNFRVEK